MCSSIEVVSKTKFFNWCVLIFPKIERHWQKLKQPTASKISFNTPSGQPEEPVRLLDTTLLCECEVYVPASASDCEQIKRSEAKESEIQDV